MIILCKYYLPLTNYDFHSWYFQWKKVIYILNVKLHFYSYEKFMKKKCLDNQWWFCEIIISLWPFNIFTHDIISGNSFFGLSFFLVQIINVHFILMNNLYSKRNLKKSFWNITGFMCKSVNKLTDNDFHWKSSGLWHILPTRNSLWSWPMLRTKGIF